MSINFERSEPCCRSIDKVEVDSNGHLIIYYSNGEVCDVGSVVTQGEPGTSYLVYRFDNTVTTQKFSIGEIKPIHIIKDVSVIVDATFSTITEMYLTDAHNNVIANSGCSDMTRLDTYITDYPDSSTVHQPSEIFVNVNGVPSDSTTGGCTVIIQYIQLF